MLSFFTTYYLDLVVISYILGGLCVISLAKQASYKNEMQKFYKNKSLFYLLSRSALILLIVHFLSLINQLKSSLETLENASIYDSLSFFEFYQKAISSEIGVTLFRTDFVSLIFVLILNVCVIFYFLLLLNYFNNTREELKYFGEIPILLMAVFFSLKYFLLAYDFIMLILCLELASLCSVVLLSLHFTSSTKNTLPIEAAIKYFLFNAISVGLLLFAITGYYTFIQSFNFLDFSLQLTLNPYFQFLNAESFLLLHFFFFLVIL